LTNEPVYQAEGNNDVVYKLLGRHPLSGEYFLVENRQKTGFDSALSGSGLLIWHIDGNKINSARSNNEVNTYECYPGGPSCAINHYGVKLMQADNLWELEKGSNYGNSEMHSGPLVIQHSTQHLFQTALYTMEAAACQSHKYKRFRESDDCHF